MSDTLPDRLTSLLELASFYPSPHNGQPIVIRKNRHDKYELYFEHDRGLKSTDISFLFSFVTMGVFCVHLEYAARALGHTVAITPKLPASEDLKGNASSAFADVAIDWNTHEPQPKLELLIRHRQTSRKKYFEGVTGTEADALAGIAKRYGTTLHMLERDQAHQTVWLNQQAVFDDMFIPAVRHELAHWLRFSRREKIEKRDGLSYDCMELSGASLKFAVRWYRILRFPVVSQLIKRYYLRTMRDDSSVGYVTAPFATERDAFQIGRAIMEMWFKLTESGKYLHPFGTIVANEQAHRDFLRIANMKDESPASDFVVFIFRAGKSAPPVRSERLPLEHIYDDGGNV